MKQWYEELFENYANKYDQECFVQGTAGECDFVEKELNNDKNLKIIDVGCGTGRHSIELTKRGYSIIGIDLSENQLAKAKEKAEKEGLAIEFKQHDARKPFPENGFDLAIMLCEGGFSLMETDEMNFEILKNVTESLNDTGKLIFTTLNGLFPIFNSTEKFTKQTSKDAGIESAAVYKSASFDLMTFRDHNVTEFEDDDGNKKELKANERFYIPSEITWLLKSLGYKKIDIYGGRFGEYSREHELTTKDFEMLVIAQK